MPHPLSFCLVSLLALAISWVVLDVYLVEKYGVAATISYQTLGFVSSNLITVVLIGLSLSILARHLFTRRDLPLWSLSNPFTLYVVATLVGWALATVWVQKT